MWFMEWGGIPDNYISEYIRDIRGIIYTFARESWKVRCTTVYSPEEEPKRKNDRHEARHEQNTCVIHKTNESKQQ
jgi:hypothetical protein